MKARILLLPLRQLCRRVSPNCAPLAANWVANLAMRSRRRNFCFLNLLNLALSPFVMTYALVILFVRDSACRRWVCQFSVRLATDGRCESQGTWRGNPLQRLRVRLLGLLLGYAGSRRGEGKLLAIRRDGLVVIAFKLERMTSSCGSAVPLFPSVNL